MAPLISETESELIAFSFNQHHTVCRTIKVFEVSDFEKLRGCVTIDGSLVITYGFFDSDGTHKSQARLIANLTFPDLVQVNHFVLIYQSTSLTTINGLFPNLAVIRGNKLIQHYALVIYENRILEDVGLTGLTEILNGGVRIMRNPNMCYVNSIDWFKLISVPFHKHIIIDKNSFANMCPDICPERCESMTNVWNKGGLDKSSSLRTSRRRFTLPTTPKSCWSETHCQRMKISTSKCSNYKGINVKHKDGGVRGNCYFLGETHRMYRMCEGYDCVGGCSETGDVCVACKHFFLPSSNKCSISCPDNQLKLNNWLCISKKECSNRAFIFTGKGFRQEKRFRAYQGSCLKSCPPNTEESMDVDDGSAVCTPCKDECPKECFPGIIQSIDAIKNFDGCTVITGDLRIQVAGKNVVNLLRKHLGRVKEIRGYLQISRSSSIISLDFFESLQVIRGIKFQNDSSNDKFYSLRISDNVNLARLFPIDQNHNKSKNKNINESVQIYYQNGINGLPQRGYALIHYNSKLCPSEIEKLIKFSNLHDPGKQSSDISYVTNGNKVSCNTNVLNATITFPSKDIMTILFDNYQQQITTKYPLADYRSLLTYQINYRSISKEVYGVRNLTKYAMRDACSDIWNVVDHLPSAVQMKDGIFNWPVESISINVAPYTFYAVFITTRIARDYSGAENVNGAESEIMYTLSPEDNPDPPQSLLLENIDFSSVNVSWVEPGKPNGIIDHYQLVLVYIPIKENVRNTRRDYCHEGYAAIDMTQMEQIENLEIFQKFNTISRYGEDGSSMSGSGVTSNLADDSCQACGEFCRIDDNLLSSQQRPSASSSFSQSSSATADARDIVEDHRFLDDVIDVVFSADQDSPTSSLGFQDATSESEDQSTSNQQQDLQYFTTASSASALRSSSVSSSGGGAGGSVTRMLHRPPSTTSVSYRRKVEAAHQRGSDVASHRHHRAYVNSYFRESSSQSPPSRRLLSRRAVVDTDPSLNEFVDSPTTITYDDTFTPTTPNFISSQINYSNIEDINDLTGEEFLDFLSDVTSNTDDDGNEEGGQDTSYDSESKTVPNSIYIDDPSSSTLGVVTTTPFSTINLIPNNQSIDSPNFDFFSVFATEIPADRRHFVVDRLQYFGLYTVSLRACHAAKSNGLKLCSAELKEQIRLLHKPMADDIPSPISVHYSNQSSNTKAVDVYLSWKAPPFPNGMITNYFIKFESSSGSNDKSGGNSQSAYESCVTAHDFAQSSRKYKLSIVGNFLISVEAVSLYGRGNWSDSVSVSVFGSGLNQPNRMIVIISVTVPVTLLIVLVIVIIYVRQRQLNKNRNWADGNPGYFPMKYKPDEWEVARKNIDMGDVIGSGAFGTVYSGVLHGPGGVSGSKMCAIKTVRQSAQYHECQMFLHEADVMKPLQTAHIVRLLGVVSAGDPHLVLLELMENGDLKEYLRCHRPDATNSRNIVRKEPLTVECLKQMALEIADGMAFLSTSTKHIIHRDLAARNCMVNGLGVVKIGDFGMAREIYTSDYYKKVDKGLMPIRWMSPESLKDGIATSACDVWSYGVVLWEMMTLAEQPYQGKSNQEVIDAVLSGHRLPKPHGATDQLASIMVSCFSDDPNKRPTFVDLCLILKKSLKKMSPRFESESFITSELGKSVIERMEDERKHERKVYDEHIPNNSTPLLSDYDYPFVETANETALTTTDENLDSSHVHDDPQVQVGSTFAIGEEKVAIYNGDEIVNDVQYCSIVNRLSDPMNASNDSNQSLNKRGEAPTKEQDVVILDYNEKSENAIIT